MECRYAKRSRGLSLDMRCELCISGPCQDIDSLISYARSEYYEEDLHDDSVSARTPG